MALAKHRPKRPQTQIRKGSDVTEEVLEIATKINDEWFGDESKVRWDAFWDRLDGAQLADGSVIDLGDQYGTQAMHKIKTHVKRIRREEY